MNPKITDLLKDLAIRNPGADGAKMAAGIVYKKSLIAVGVNQYKTHPLMAQNGYRDGQVFLHAEVDAIRNALKYITEDQLAKCQLYVVRVKRPYANSRKWVDGLAKPCPGCRKTIKRFGIESVFWTEDFDKKEVDFCVD